jgi:hypothetical protein
MIWEDGGRVYLAGQRVAPGRYRRVEPADGRMIELERWDALPASLDGRVAVYLRVEERTPAPARGATGRSAASRPVPLD